MASQQQQPTWEPPFDPPPDCSQGFCTIYCPQWCNIYTPPPPFDIIDGGDSSSDGPTFSPLVIAIIGILAAAFLLVTYYTIISKYCVRLRSRQEHHRHRQHPPPDPTGDSVIDAEHETWYVSPANGLDEALISKIAVCKYKRGDRLVEFTDCSVCLGEFREDESLRLLPKCSHAFHIHCIDTWLKSHSNCPLCRANVVSMSPSQTQLVAPPPPPSPPPPPPLPPQTEEVVVAVENIAEELSTSDCNSDGLKEVLEGEDDDNRSIRRSFSMGSWVRDRVSVADILQVSMEDEYNMAKEKGLLVEGGSSSRGDHRGESKRSRNLLTAMSPVPMKRSMSSGRFGLSRQGKGRNLVLPL